MILSGWRLTDPEYAITPEQMMSGVGAYLHGGRWNSKGIKVVYLGSSLAQAAMEQLVHLLPPDVLRGYRKMEVLFDESLVQHIDLGDLPEDWAAPSMVSSVQAVGDAWVKDGSSLVLQVPSAAVPGEFNYLFNPEHPDKNKAEFGEITTFSYDTRLLKQISK